MNPELEEIRKKIVALVGKIDPESWVDAQVIFNFPPFINKGYNGTYLFKDEGNKILPIFLPFDIDLQNQILHFIFKYNRENQYNTITFDIRRNDYENATIDISFNQEIENNFQNSLPKSQRGKTIPWWKNPDEIRGLL